MDFTCTVSVPAHGVEGVLEGDRLAPIGVGAGRLPGRLGVGEVLGYDPQTGRLGREPGARDTERGLERVDHDFAALISIPWKAFTRLVFSE